MFSPFIRNDIFCNQWLDPKLEESGSSERVELMKDQVSLHCGRIEDHARNLAQYGSTRICIPDAFAPEQVSCPISLGAHCASIMPDVPVDNRSSVNDNNKSNELIYLFL